MRKGLHSNKFPAGLIARFARFTVSGEDDCRWFFRKRSAEAALAAKPLRQHQSGLLFHWHRDGKLELLKERVG